MIDRFAPSLGIGEIPSFDEVMHRINSDNTVSEGLARAALLEVLNMDHETCRAAKLGSLLMGTVKIATPELVTGFVKAVGDFDGRDFVKDRITVDGIDGPVVGCAGSGKKGTKTVNITTPAMVVAAAAGANVVKSGSRSTSSLTGSTDVLELSGFKIPEDNEVSNYILKELGFGFYSIEGMIPRFDRIYGNHFYAPHTLSYVLPAALTPVKVDTMMYGFSGSKVSLSSSALVRLGFTSNLVYSNTNDGVHYIDEIASTGTSMVCGARDGEVGETLSIDAADYFDIRDQAKPGIKALTTAEEHASAFQSVLNGEFKGSEAENTVCLNAGSILYLCGVTLGPKDGFALAQETIRSGASKQKLDDIVAMSNDL